MLHYLCSAERDDFRPWSAGTVLHLQAIRRVFGERIMEQLRAAGSALTVRRLDQGDVLEF